MRKLGGPRQGNIIRLVRPVPQQASRLLRAKGCRSPGHECIVPPIFFRRIAPVITHRLGIEISVQGHMHA